MIQVQRNDGPEVRLGLSVVLSERSVLGGDSNAFSTSVFLEQLASAHTDIYLGWSRGGRNSYVFAWSAKCWLLITLIMRRSFYFDALKWESSRWLELIKVSFM